jgi:hypothetical protein
LVALLWAVAWVGTATGVRNLDMDMESELVETETGWQFGDDDIEPFANATAPAPAPAVKVSGSVIPLINGDFELTNVTGNATVLADSTSTAIINWLPGGAGVQILFGVTYNMAPETPKSAYCIHLNNPASTGNGTQGSLSTTLAAAAATGKTYTVQYDTARMPDGPINLWSALKVSAVEGGTVNSWVVKNPVYNASDTESHITWQRQSFVYTGTGAQTVIKFESMSEKYGPMIDNVQILSGKHELAAAPLGKMAGVCQRSVPLLTLLALQAFQPQLRLQL